MTKQEQLVANAPVEHMTIYQHAVLEFMKILLPRWNSVEGAAEEAKLKAKEYIKSISND